MSRNLNKLSSNIEWTGDYGSKARGEEYFDKGRVSPLFTTEDAVYARSKGTQNYITTLEWAYTLMDNLELVCSCSCPSYKRFYSPCKHVWALLKEVDDHHRSNIFFKRMKEFHEETPLIDDIYLTIHYDCDDFTHLSLTSYQNKVASKRCESEEAQPNWQKDLQNLERYITDAKDDELKTNPIKRPSTIWYEFEPYSGIQIYSQYDFLNISFHEASTLKNGTYGSLKKKSFKTSFLPPEKYPKDSKFLNLLKGHFTFDYTKYASEAAVPSSLGILTLTELATSNRLFVYSHDNKTGHDITALQMGNGVFSFSADIAKDKKNWILGGLFILGQENIDAQQALLSTDLSFIVHNHHIYKTDLGKLRTHCEYLIGYGNIVIPLDQKDELKRVIKNTIGLEQTLLDKDFGVEKKILCGSPIIEIVIDQGKSDTIIAELKFKYDSELHTPSSKQDIFNDSSVNDLFYIKDRNFEQSILTFLERSSSIFNIEHIDHYTFNIKTDEFNDFVEEANNLKIEIRTLGYKVKHYNSPSLSVSGSNDWFELKGSIAFDTNSEISIPEIIKKKTLDNNFIILGDGTIGVKPSVWLSKMEKLAELGVKEENIYKFNRAQSIILDLLLTDSNIQITKDLEFRKTVEALRSFKGIEKTKISKRFVGELRCYQNSGMNWLNFLHNFQIGGCLADDMGLGKTIQVLAHLQKIKGQHLIVVPKSLVYNWQAEAGKFTPDLKVFIYEGAKREGAIKSFKKFDLIIMTYAVMRKDIQKLKEFEFSYAVLDEAQNIKNPTTLVAKAAYLINSKYKLALTGTPVENHIGELFSIFKFLIPNILPKGYSLGKIKSNDESMKVILRGLMPFILRRTKSEVLKDLPEKVETVLYCDFEKKQKSIYNEMKSFYQKSLTQKIKKDSINKSKIQILEALLRMRQVSCHPGLVNKDYLSLSSSKLNILMENLDSLLARNEKVLIFSQFTSFLSIIKDELEKNSISYSYLDGQTQKRQTVVDDFKTSKTKNVFLISLKAGGVGLNLTEANYCFLVDPWWNPAVEAQAIDRIHRIGQSKKVFAYRLITKGSIEEKILKLQESKKSVSKNILTTDDSLLRQMSSEDLQFLFK